MKFKLNKLICHFIGHESKVYDLKEYRLKELPNKKYTLITFCKRCGKEMFLLDIK